MGQFRIREWPWNTGWLVFMGWVISKANESLTVWITTNCGKFLRDGNTRLPYKSPKMPLSLYAGQEVTVRNGHGTMDWFKIGKGV